MNLLHFDIKRELRQKLRVAYTWVVWFIAVELFISILDIWKAKSQLPHSISQNREHAFGIIFWSSDIFISLFKLVYWYFVASHCSIAWSTTTQKNTKGSEVLIMCGIGNTKQAEIVKSRTVTELYIKEHYSLLKLLWHNDWKYHTFSLIAQKPRVLCLC